MILLSFIPYAVYGGMQTGSDGNAAGVGGIRKTPCPLSIFDPGNAAGVGGIRRRLTTCTVGVLW